MRSVLPQFGREALDQAMLEMQRDEDLVLYTLDNVREITDADREAALDTGMGEPRYILYLGVQ